jgi:hypothetical protein
MEDGILAQINKKLGVIVGLLGFIGFVISAGFAYIHPGSPSWVPASRAYIHSYVEAVDRVESLRSRIALNQKLINDPDTKPEDRQALEATVAEQIEELELLERRHGLNQ